MSRRPRRPDNRSEDNARGLPLRVAMMDTERRQRARRLRRAGHAPEEIARRLDATIEEVAAALGALRGRRDDPNHLNLSVTRATGEYFRSLAEPGEPTWQLMDRIAVVVRGALADQAPRRRPSRSHDRPEPRQGGLLAVALAALLGCAGPLVPAEAAIDAHAAPSISRANEER